jgi:hypothetical protein
MEDYGVEADIGLDATEPEDDLFGAPEEGDKPLI